MGAIEKKILGHLKEKGYTFYAGVPCSMLGSLIDTITSDKSVTYIPAVRENAALGVASGAYLAGKGACVLMQNSGVGNVVNALTSFNLIYKIPVLFIISWRGFKGKDAPEHIIMGEKTIPLLKELGVPHRVLSNRYKEDIDWALGVMKKKRIPASLILPKGLLE